MNQGPLCTSDVGKKSTLYLSDPWTNSRKHPIRWRNKESKLTKLPNSSKQTEHLHIY